MHLTLFVIKTIAALYVLQIGSIYIKQSKWEQMGHFPPIWVQNRTNTILAIPNKLYTPRYICGEIKIKLTK